MIPARYKGHPVLGQDTIAKRLGSAVFRFRPDARTVECDDPIEMKIQGANRQAGTNGNSSRQSGLTLGMKAIATAS